MKDILYMLDARLSKDGPLHSVDLPDKVQKRMETYSASRGGANRNTQDHGGAAGAGVYTDPYPYYMSPAYFSDAGACEYF